MDQGSAFERWGSALSAWGAFAAAVVGLVVWLHRRLGRALRGTVEKTARDEVQKALKPIIDKLPRLDEVYSAMKPEPGGRSLLELMAGSMALLRAIDARQSEDAIRNSTMMCALSIGEMGTDKHGRVVRVNRAMCRMLRRSESDLMSRNWFNAVHTDDRPRVLEEWRSALSDQRQCELAFRFSVEDGEAVHVDLEAQPVVDSERRLVGWLAVVVPHDPGAMRRLSS